MDRTTRSVIIIYLLFALLCTQIPLFNYLGFEYSALSALLCSFVTGLAVLSWFRPGKDHFEFWKPVRGLFLRVAILLLLPIMVMFLNAAFVKNCSLIDGLLLFILIVPGGVVFAFGLSVFIAVSNWKWKRTLFSALFVLILLHIVWVTISGPQIYSFNPIIGYFPGLTYDESLQVESRLTVYRLGTFGYAFLFLMAACARWQWKVKKAPGLRARDMIRQLEFSKFQIGAVVVALVVIGGLQLFDDALELRSSEGHIRRQLGGVLEGDHVVLVYPRDEVNDAEAMNLLNFHEFLYERISRDLRTDGGHKITSYVYKSPEQKGRLIGAGRTDIAKPWLRQLHVNLDDVAEVLKHEMSHVIAADFGFPLFRVGLNPGLIEGLAVAVEREAYGDPLHQMAGQILALGISPDIESLFSVWGFIRAQPTVSYTLAGSFCRYLIDTYGLRKFKRLYKSGSFESVYKKTAADLIDRWKRSLAHYTFSGEELRRASFLFKRPTIFARECVRVIADLNEATSSHLQQNKLDQALQSSEKSLSLTNNPTAIFQHARVLLRLGRFGDARSFVQMKLADSTMISSLYPLYLMLGDAAWGAGDRHEAIRAYETLLDIHLSAAWDEICEVRLMAVQSAELSDSLFSYFSNFRDDSLKIDFLHRLHERNPTEPLVSYLLGNAYLGKREFSEANTFYAQAAFDRGILEFLRLQRLGYISFRLRTFQKAKMLYWQSLNHTRNEAVILQTMEMIDRCEWTRSMMATNLRTPL